MRSPNVTWHSGSVSREERWAALAAGGCTVWMTGLPSSGKSTLASAAERQLLATGRPAYVLDGDNLRHGLNGDLGFDAADRAENVRRAAHLARVLADAGSVVLVALVSPYERDRALARSIHDEAGLPFLEVYVSTPLEECERRDPKGLYARARRGEIRHFTGVDDPYEPPRNPELELAAGEELERSLERLLAAVATEGAWIRS